MAAKRDLVSLQPYVRPNFVKPTLWKRRFETYLIAVRVTDNNQKRALLLYQVRSEMQETIPGDANDYVSAMNWMTISLQRMFFSSNKPHSVITTNLRQGT